MLKTISLISLAWVIRLHATRINQSNMSESKWLIRDPPVFPEFCVNITTRPIVSLSRQTSRMFLYTLSYGFDWSIASKVRWFDGGCSPPPWQSHLLMASIYRSMPVITLDIMLTLELLYVFIRISYEGSFWMRDSYGQHNWLARVVECNMRLYSSRLTGVTPLERKDEDSGRRWEKSTLNLSREE